MPLISAVTGHVTHPQIHRVAHLHLTCESWTWPFAEQQRTEIDAHFARQQREKPRLWNGRLLLGRNPVFSDDVFTASYFETDFASFLAWRDWGYPDKTVFNGFGMGALRSSDGAFVLGEMGPHTANAGRVYFPAGTPDLDDLRGTTVDIAGSVAREVEEEAGLTAADYRAAPRWDCVVTDSSIAMMQILESDLSGHTLREQIEATLSRQDFPELVTIHLVRTVADLTPAMPLYVTAFLEAQFGGRA